MKPQLLHLATIALIATACSSSSSTTTAAEGKHAASTDASVTQPTSATSVPTGSLVFTPQPGWVVERPTSAMRKAQFLLPHADSDSEDASLVVYFFGGQGGGKQANIDRWASQFEQPDGRRSQDVMQTSMRSVHGMHVDEVDLAGTYVAETFPGSGERVRKENWRMLASIVESVQGPHYIKVVGPAATIARWETSYRRFVSDLQ